MKKVLHIVSSWGTGGVERYISDYVNEINGYTFDVLAIRGINNDSIFTGNVVNMGGSFFSLPQSKGNIIGRTRVRNKYLSEFIKNNKYDIIHINAGTADAFLLAKIIKEQDSKIKIIMHCHGSNVEAPKKVLKRLFHQTCKLLYGNNIDYCIGVSQITLEWMFSEKILRTKPKSIFSCGIDVEKFKYNDVARRQIREEINIKNEFVIGTIGRFTEQKNPFYIVDIIKEVTNKCTDIKFLWVGDGRLLKEVKTRTKELGIYDKFIFYGISEVIPDILSAMDLFILPSCFEGNPIVGLEAQASGLKCIFSSEITEEVNVTNMVEFMSIDEPAKKWAKKIIEYMSNEELIKNRSKNNIKLVGADVKENAQKLKDIYEILSGCEKR